MIKRFVDFQNTAGGPVLASMVADPGDVRFALQGANLDLTE